jgi:hypothetical protein
VAKFLEHTLILALLGAGTLGLVGIKLLQRWKKEASNLSGIMLGLLALSLTELGLTLAYPFLLYPLISADIVVGLMICIIFYVKFRNRLRIDQIEAERIALEYAKENFPSPSQTMWDIDRSKTSLIGRKWRVHLTYGTMPDRILYVDGLTGKVLT